MNFYQIKSWIRHALSAATAYKLHSPFVYALHTDVIQNKGYRAEYDEPGRFRRELARHRQVINRTDLGSGEDGPITVRRFAKSSAARPKTGKLLLRLTDHFKPKTILELGTATGLSTMYLARGAPESTCITLEGCPETAQLARSNLHQAGIGNVEVVVGDFAETLPRTLMILENIGFCFIDGNHRERPTLDYFAQIIGHCSEGSVLAFHDIHMSEGMNRAWKTICDHQAATITIDLFDVGLVFFRKQAKQHFTLRW